MGIGLQYKLINQEVPFPYAFNLWKLNQTRFEPIPVNFVAGASYDSTYQTVQLMGGVAVSQYFKLNLGLCLGTPAYGLTGSLLFHKKGLVTGKSQ